MTTGPTERNSAPFGLVADLGPEALATLMAISQDGIAVLDEHRRYLLVNQHGCTILGIAADDAVGQPAFAQWTAGERGHARDESRHRTRCTATLRRHDANGERELAYGESSFTTTGGRMLSVVTFRDMTELRRQQRRIASFAVAASRVAYAGSLRATLDAVCTEVVRTAGLAGVQILLIDPEDLRMRVYGAAPELVFPEKFALLLHEARQRGAELNSLEALREGRPVITPNRKTQMLADPAWEPLHEHLRGFDWETFVSVPLIIRDRALGAMNAYYHPGQEPDEEDVGFLTSMADQAAVAAENARLVDDLKGKAELEERHRLARELHDSVCQELFSMNLHIRAAKLALARDPAIDEDVLSRRLGTLEELGRAALEDMRALVVELHPILLHKEGLIAAIRQHAASITSREDLNIEVEAGSGRIEIAGDSELDAYRIVQEALHNAVKHSHAEAVHVYVGPDPSDEQTLILRVADDGRGFDCNTATPGRLGLASMRERAERLGGEFVIVSTPGSGTIVRVEVPRALNHSAADAQQVPPGVPTTRR